jgi:putative hemolysin
MKFGRCVIFPGQKKEADMIRKSSFFIGVIVVVLVLSACRTEPDMPNPASAYCEEQGGTVDIRMDSDTGGQVGYCVFADGSECEEWAFYRGECAPGDSLTDIADMPNPASVYCEEQGGTVDIRTDPETGGQVGYCVFADGSECDEWAFYRGECAPGDSLTDIADMPNPASVYCEEQGGTLEIREDLEGGQIGYCRFADGSLCEEWAFFRGECLEGGIYPVETIAEDGWKVYENEKLGYRFHFPPDAILVSADGSNQTITIQGPMVDDDYWPMIFFNHPDNLPEYLVPDGVDLEDWLNQQNLMMGERLEERVVAGETAIHLRQVTGEQAFPSDQFFFAKNGRLFSVVFLHTGDLEDWDLYDQFLDSIQFE